MKSSILSLSVALLLSTAAHVDAADPVTLADTVCSSGSSTSCLNPAPQVSILSYSATYRRMMVTLNGVQYDSGIGGASEQGGTLYASDGSYIAVQTVFATWSTLVRTGHNFYVTHWELKSGTIQ